MFGQEFGEEKSRVGNVPFQGVCGAIGRDNTVKVAFRQEREAGDDGTIGLDGSDGQVIMVSDGNVGFATFDDGAFTGIAR
ncbi:hypothetical protein Barb7_02038 [Bacteroidales bacterium Barb7]|nr:hypothetical protein Barb7_02038 [Bacteroidales bacterium Barb7]